MTRRRTETKESEPGEINEIRTIYDLKQDESNANLGSHRGAKMLRLSLERHGAGRSVLVDKNGVLIAGNKTAEAALEAGMAVKVVQTEGDELVVVQRTDLDMSGTAFSKARELAFADNRVSEVSLNWDPEEVMKFGNALGEDIERYFNSDEMNSIIREAMAAINTAPASPVASPAGLTPAGLTPDRSPPEVLHPADGKKESVYDVWESAGGFDMQLEDLSAYRQIVISFKDEEDIAEFSRVIGQPIGKKTKWLWFPPRAPKPVEHLRFEIKEREDD